MIRPTRITAQIVEKNVQQQRQLEVQRRDLAVFASENAKLMSAANAQVNVEAQRRRAFQLSCESELEYQRKVQEEERVQRYMDRSTQQNKLLATALDIETVEEQRRSREIQRICEESPELRDLERALKTAYLSKERVAQQQEKIILDTLEKERIQAIEDKMEYDRQMAIKSEGDKIGEKKKLYEDQKRVLQRQIAEREEMLREAQRQTEADKETVDAIVRRINEEDQAEMRKKRELQLATAKMIKDFEEQRKREIAEKKAALKAEEDEINAYNKAMESRSEGLAAQKQAKKDEEDRILQKIVEETSRKRREEEEFNNLRDMLWEEELEAKSKRDADQRRQKQEDMKREMMIANEYMKEKKKEQRILEAEAESRMVSLMRRKFAEDEARERAEEEGRRKAKVHHMTLIEKQRQQRHEMYQQEKNAEASQNQEILQREEYRKQVIQEARKRLLEEHAAKLKGFMPRGAIQNNEEFDVFQRASS